ncbi:MAG: FkbM family methyltransferase [Bacteroidetes bacterium]|nr:FkbM family methyltransferase [Bacteroidota bacterium]MBU2466726.1 FkbM family methyltransferase [Bacteroidota bacterium]MBU2557330.1 FkbM family methyltransferase [Bacteroidota bacterium]
MKAWVKKILQKLLGFDSYLFLFSLFVINTLKWNKKEGDFLHFLNLIPETGTILDIGANIGIMSVWLGKNRPQAQIISFEPIPHNIKALRKVLEFYKLKNVTVVEKALGNSNGEVNMVMPVLDKVKMQGLSHVVHESITEFNKGKSFTTPITTLDDCELLKNTTSAVTAIKLDVENFEFFVLDGAKKIISKYRPLIYTELWENDNRQKCFDLMKSSGYQIKVLNDKKLIDFDPKKHHTQNFFFIP